MEFINSRKHQSKDEAANKIRQSKYHQNFIVITFMHSLGFFIVVAFFAHPLVDYAINTSYRFPQPLYIPIDFASHSLKVYGIAYVLVCFAAHNSGILVIATLMYFNSIAEFLTAEFRILGTSFETALEKENVVKYYKTIIKHHQELLR